MTDNDTVYLGFVNDDRKFMKKLCPWDNRIGGVGCIYGTEPLAVPKCERCSRPLYLVAQVAADTVYERSLLIYACNSSSCYENGAIAKGSWKVFRSQGRRVSKPESGKPVEETKLSTKPVEWGAGWGSAGGWGLDSAGGWDEMSESQEPVAKSTDEETCAAETSSALEALTPFVACEKTPYSFPCYEFEMFEEGPEAVDADSESDSDDDRVPTGKHGSYTFHHSSKESKQKKGSSQQFEDRYIQELYSKYLKEEQETGAQHESESATGHSAASGGGDSEEGKGEKYEKLPAPMRYMMNFKNHLELNPDQIVRYHVTGTPLFPTPDARMAVKHVPACANCGSARKFELQVLPTVLVYLAPDDNPAEQVESELAGSASAAEKGNTGSKEAGKPATKLMSLFEGGGMDFLSVYVYTCAKSCNGGDETAPVLREEHAVVIPGSMGQ